LVQKIFEEKVTSWMTSQANGMYFLNKSVSAKSSNKNLQKIKDWLYLNLITLLPRRHAFSYDHLPTKLYVKSA